MSEKTLRFLKYVLCYTLIAAMIVTFIPLSAVKVSAAAFSKANAVSGLTVSGKGFYSVTLKWNKYKGATGYKVYRAASKDGKYELRTSTKKLTCRSKGTPGKTYYYKVRAYHKNSGTGKTVYSKYSAVKDARSSAAAPNAKASLSAEKIKVKWDAVSGATGYQIVRASSKDGTYKNMWKTKGLYYNNSSLAQNIFYYYKVRAYKKEDGKTYYGPYCSPVKAITTLPATTSLKFTTTKTAVTVKWSAVDHAGSYGVYRAASEEGPFKKLAVATGTSYTDKTVRNKSKYYYRIRAIVPLNGYSYYGKRCAPKSVYFTTSEVPIVTVKPQEASVKLSWQSFSNITGYEVWRATSKNGTYKKLGVNTKSPAWENDELTIGTKYYYKVRTYKKSNGKTTYGEYSDPVVGMTAVLAPANIKASAASGGIKLSWTAPKNAEGYEITRATSANGTYKKVGTATTASFVDSNGLTKGTKYFYKIRGYAKYDDTIYYGNYSMSSASREKVVEIATEWLGCKESNGSHKKIIDVYNSKRAPGCGKLPYSAAWCAAFVSAVGIKADATSIIVRHSYCPTMFNTYKDKGRYSTNKKYTPSPGDIIFYDWNKNKQPDHVGMIVSCGSTIKAIEGNKNDAVGYRTFSKGYSLILGYGLPAYNETSGITYTGTTTQSVAVEALAAAGISSTEPEGYSDIGEEYDAAENELSKGCGEDATEVQKMEVILESLKENADTENLKDCNKSEYNAAFLYKLCADAAIEASIVSEQDEDGDRVAWVEATLDGQLYKIDPSEEDPKPVKYTPEVTDYNEAAAGETEESEGEE